MPIDFLLERFAASQNKDALIWRDQVYSYAWMLHAVQQWQARLQTEGVPVGAVISLEADFSPQAVALLLALIDRRCIIVPLTTSIETKKPEFCDIAQVEVRLMIDDADSTQCVTTGVHADHTLLRQLKESQRPGLVLFSSGSTGKSKAAVHDFVPLLEKFHLPRPLLRTISFLLFDHIGGVNTLLHTLSNGGCAITVQQRSPDAVCQAIDRYKAQLLPTSPTFINLLLLSEAYTRHNLSSLELVTYGTEVMPESTLRRFHELFPHIRLLQTYGLSEIGILRSKSKSSDSLWVKLGGEGFTTRVVDGMLEIKAKSVMLGYLNAATPFTVDGWFQTGDAVEVDGEYVRILGRKSELINIGGEKVYPAEVESILQQMEGVDEVVVTGERNPITGQIVKAHVRLKAPENISEFRKRMYAFCQDKLPKVKIPQKVVVVTDELHSERFKKMRREFAR